MLEKNDSSVPFVGVLLATHHPTLFIADQIASIKDQRGVAIKVYWGDYGSSGEEKDYVRGLLKNLNHVEIEIEKPGPAANFFELLKYSKENFIAFADQDDYWLPNKLLNQVNLMKDSPLMPSLAHSNIEKWVAGKRIRRKSICRDHQVATLAISNCCQGCTIMINSTAREVILRTLPDRIIWHDWWMGLVISITGKIYLAEETEVLYRLHEGNTIGIPTMSQRLKNFQKKGDRPASHQIRQAIDQFGYLLGPNSSTLQLLQNLISDNWKKRLIGNIKAKRTRSNIIEEILHRIAWTLRKP